MTLEDGLNKPLRNPEIDSAENAAMRQVIMDLAQLALGDKQPTTEKPLIMSAVPIKHYRDPEELKEEGSESVLVERIDPLTGTVIREPDLSKGKWRYEAIEAIRKLEPGLGIRTSIKVHNSPSLYRGFLLEGHSWQNDKADLYFREPAPTDRLLYGWDAIEAFRRMVEEGKFTLFTGLVLPSRTTSTT